jgi:hypothetical protein
MFARMGNLQDGMVTPTTTIAIGGTIDVTIVGIGTGTAGTITMIGIGIVTIVGTTA